ncbi:hypothetical protein [Saccharothrix sp. ST-888]|uniref:hypothetical protein n=1 Tax=Saccharothrix sp. ST-888 TaxID=1427391 RepID=UPI0005ED16C3|nr:hypothetical protein [Saccharothrix sp. ST-888]KJK58518.1 hypothetical protein UK12_09670 [Saccharothrix sp. ST-888]
MTRPLRRALLVTGFGLVLGLSFCASLWISHQNWVRNSLLIAGPWLLLLVVGNLRSSARQVRRRLGHRPHTPADERSTTP